jgi:hypothetical protein
MRQKSTFILHRTLVEWSWFTTNIEENYMEMESLKNLMVDELKDLYSAENQILKALPKMISIEQSLTFKRSCA